MTAQTPVRETHHAGRAGGIGALVVLGVLAGAVVAAGIVLALGERFGDLGLPDPGTITTAGLPVVRTIVDCAAAVTVGSLMFAAFLVPPQTSGYLSAGGYAAVRTARTAGLVWTVAAAAMVPFSAAAVVGRPVTDLLDIAVLADLSGRLSETGAWTLTAGIALLVTGLSWNTLTWTTSVCVFAASLVGLLPVALTGHSSSGGAHDIATNSLLFHVLAAALWVGGLIAVLAHLARRGEHAGLAAARFSRIALVCWIVMGLSGVLNAYIRVTPSQLFTTSYGVLVLAKTGALLALGVLGYLHRRGAVAAVGRGDARAMLRLGAGEVLLMLATIGLAVGLGRSAPPPAESTLPSRTEVLIGYDLAGAPSALRYLTEWRFDLVLGTAALVMAGVYVAGVLRLRRRGDAWPVGRTIAWLLGCATVLVATSSGLGRYSMAVFSAHMGVHMALSMLAPILLVLGGPMTLALRALPAARGDDPPGPREWVLALAQSRLLRVLTQPLVALAIYTASYFLLYFTGIYDAGVSRHWAHIVMNTHFLLAGYTYFWIIVGVDPAPRRLPHLAKLGLLLASMPFHAFFGIALMGSDEVIGGDFYRQLALPFLPDLLADQRAAGAFAWAAGEVPLVVVLLALLVQWARSDTREARRIDRRADADGDADLAAYNAMLAGMGGKDTDRRPD